MRSKVAKRILANTPKEVKDEVKELSNQILKTYTMKNKNIEVRWVVYEHTYDQDLSKRINDCAPVILYDDNGLFASKKEAKEYIENRYKGIVEEGTIDGCLVTFSIQKLYCFG